MENLIIKNSNRKLVGLIWILGGIGLLVARIIRNEVSDFSDLINPVMFCLLGIILMTPLAGYDKAKIEIFDQGLRIRWVNWYRKVTVLESDIESIILASNGVLIKKKDGKSLKIKFYLLDKNQKELVYKFFTEYAREKDFTREKQLQKI